ncbi:MAG TPA: 50S ribosomal protein L6 [Steroidobacter sp.]|jgi:large subunit ribosomal protein L6|nr:50S ribosomal protein L6 [Steroidobacteraceae bacterium]HLS82325.1 50S ribosomal protein L6 [Steroidobacter sp.]
MSRVAKQPVPLPQGVTATISATEVTVKGGKGVMTLPLNSRHVRVVQDADALKVEKATLGREANMLAGTVRAHLANIVHGVSKGYERKLELVGVGYRAQAQGKNLNLTLGFSHPVTYVAPEGVTIETPSQTEILVKGFDVQKVGQVAADIRAFRPPEPYKGKGVRYAGEKIELKEAKKK